jgi:hypothetical protein
MSEAQTSPGGVVTAIFLPGIGGSSIPPAHSQVVPDQNVIEEQMRSLANILSDQFLSSRKNGRARYKRAKQQSFFNDPDGAVIYVRVSRDRQVDNTSLDSQERACRAYCQSQGWKVVRLFREAGASAKAECKLDSARIDEIKIVEVLEFGERVLCNVPMLWRECSLDQQQRLQQVLFPEGVLYHQRTGYRTHATCLFFTMLGNLEGKNGLVALTGIEPVSQP